MKRIFILIGVFAWLSGMQNARGQSIGPSTINATGGTGTIGSNIFDWSIGEMTMVSTFTGSSVIVTQGVLQNNKSSTGIQTPSAENYVQVFPNPANTYVNLQYTTSSPGLLSYKLMDMGGRIIISNNTILQQGVTLKQLNIADLAAATYMLEVTFKHNDGSEENTSFKIEKLN